MKKRILLYYKYISLPNVAEIVTWQKTLCKDLGLTGRVLLATEGINGTLCGSIQATNQYIEAMNNHALFGNIDFKDSLVSDHYDYFPKLRVIVKKEICKLGIAPEELTTDQGGQHLTPEQTHTLMQDKPDDLIILDTRNSYETRIGTFKDAIIPDIQYFRQFPEYIDQHEDLFKDKEVLMFCTGGVRCERATAYLNTKNIAKKVYQIEGGIHRYAEKYPDGFFRGKNYVFDNRIAVKVNDDVLANCDLCNVSCDDMTNCRNSFCNKQFISCPGCLVTLDNCCSQNCFDLIEAGKVPRREHYPTVSQKKFNS